MSADAIGSSLKKSESNNQACDQEEGPNGKYPRYHIFVKFIKMGDIL